MNIGKTLLIALTLFISGQALAGQLHRVPVANSNPGAEVKALETFYGEVISMNQVINVQQPVNIRKIMASHQIELKYGQIFYPEEVEYSIEEAVMPKRGSLEKAPHTPD